MEDCFAQESRLHLWIFDQSDRQQNVCFKQVKTYSYYLSKPKKNFLIYSKNDSKFSQINRYDIESILNTENFDEVSTELTSKGVYESYFQNSFQIFKDQDRIIGVNGKQPCSLLLENIVDTNPHHSSFGFGNHSQRKRSIVINEDLQTLVVGDFSGTVIQYDLCNGRSSLKVIRHYGNIGIGRILSSTRINNFVIFGGDSFCFRVIDTAKRMMVTSSN